MRDLDLLYCMAGGELSPKKYENRPKAGSLLSAYFTRDPRPMPGAEDKPPPRHRPVEGSGGKATAGAAFRLAHLRLETRRIPKAMPHYFREMRESM